MTNHSVAAVEVEEDGDDNDEQDESAQRPGHRLHHHHLALRGSCTREQPMLLHPHSLGSSMNT